MQKQLVKRNLGFIILLLGMIHASQALDLTEIDLSYQYDPNAPVKVSHRATQKGDLITIFLRIEADSIDLWQRGFLLQNGYDDQDHQTISPKISPIEITSKTWIGKISFTEVNRTNLLILRLSADFNFYFDMPLKEGWQSPSYLKPFTSGLPILEDYTNSGNLEWGSRPPKYVSRYTENLKPAEPPMEEMKALAPVVLEDTAYLMPDTAFVEDYRFYFFHEDSANDVGISLLKVPAYFPKFRRIGELIGPMKYITTEAEYRSLRETNKPKRTFDEFWINTYGTKFRARNAIRNFYQSVELANTLFTHFKQGWKTDQGMIYIVYGAPLEVYRKDNGELWVYEDVEFDFVKVSTLFAPVFALRKDRKYEKNWYKQVGRLRKGE